MSFDIIGLLLAMGAGIVGGAFGGILGFFFVGLLVVAAVVSAAVGGPDLTSLPFGVWGPHAAGFASGVAAAAYLGSKGKNAGRDIVTMPVGFNEPMALVVGAIFGGIGFIVLWILNLVPGGWTDKVALTVWISAIIVRYAFGKTGIFGKKPAGQSLLGKPPAGSEWLPWQQDWLQVSLIALGAACLGAYLARTVGVDKGGAILGFGLSAISLVFFFAGAKPPVTHQGTLLAGVAFAASGSLIWGIVIGFLATIVAEFASRTMLIYGDTHIDPPAVAIAIMTTVSFILASLGIYAMLPLP